MTADVAPRTRRRSLSLRQVVWISLGAATAVVVGSIVLSFAARVTVAHAVAELSGHIQPVQDQIGDLNKAYVDQETGQRGFMLTGDPQSLEPYRTGMADANQLTTKLRANLASDALARDQLGTVVQAADRWTTQYAEPQIRARRAGPIPADQLKAATLQGKQLFDQLRAALAALDTRTDQLITQQIDRVRAAQRLATLERTTTLVLLLIVGVSGIVICERLLTRPVNRLVHDVRGVANGDYDQPIRQGGPQEIAVLAHATETMRDNLRSSAVQLAESERRDEQARMAADLHDRIIQRVFGLGLGLTSAARRRSRDLTPFINETDEIIHDLRQVIFDLDKATGGPGGVGVRLRTTIIEQVEHSAIPLGFTPTLDFDGPIDECASRPGLQAAVLAVLQEALSNVARHAKATAVTVRVVASGDEFCLSVRDNGVGVSASARDGQGNMNIRHRAEQLGGSAAIRMSEPDGGTVVEWNVPTRPRADPE